MLYAPIPVPLFDVYAKAGVAWLRTNGDTQAFNTSGPCQQLPCSLLPYHFSRSTTDPAFGAGVQLKLSKLALRAEYERVVSSAVEPDLVSLGLMWTF